MRRPAVTLGLAGAGLFVAALDAYVVVTLLPAMIGDVGLTIERFEQATPIVTGFLAGYVVAMPLLGAYSDARGRIPVYLACLGAFAAGSVVTATAGEWSLGGLPWMVGGRFIQGLGGGGMVPLALALAADLYSGRARTLARGTVAGLQEAGSVLGPIYGATLAAGASSAGGWRFVFWLNLPLAALCGVGLWLASRGSTTTPEQRERSHVDLPSAPLLGAGLGLLVLALYPDDPEHRAVNALFVPAGALAVPALAASGWPANELALHLGPLRQADVALAICGLGFGLVIAPLTAGVLALTSGQSHGLATSLVVLARTMGMLVGLSALTAFGLFRFHQILGTPVLTDPDLRERVKHLERLVAAAFLQEYREIFLIAGVVCLAAAVVIAWSLRPARTSGGT